MARMTSDARANDLVDPTRIALERINTNGGRSSQRRNNIADRYTRRIQDDDDVDDLFIFWRNRRSWYLISNNNDAELDLIPDRTHLLCVEILIFIFHFFHQELKYLHHVQVTGTSVN
jgi:hypothetical protein